jgi:predicted SAM-dependent methyltransferase
MSKINIGSSSTRYEGFINLDIAPGPEVDILGSFTNIPVGDNSVSVLYSNASFEHVYLKDHDKALEECYRVLEPGGALICLSLPDFGTIAKLYLDRSPGIMGPRFDLFNVYRYTHGWPEMGGVERSTQWIGQLHKSLFDPIYLHQILRKSKFWHEGESSVFRYSFKGEVHPLCLGLVAIKSGGKWGNHCDPDFVFDIETPWVKNTIIETGTYEVIKGTFEEDLLATIR